MGLEEVSVYVCVWEVGMTHLPEVESQCIMSQISVCYIFFTFQKYCLCFFLFYFFERKI